MHLLPRIFREHLAAIRYKQGSQDLSSILLHGLWLSLRLKLLDYYSPMLKDVILQTNYKSLNLYAENIFSYMSLSRDSIGSRRRSSEVVSSFWKEKGLASDKIFQVDGSGLSMKNAINASFLVDLLVYMKTQSRYSSTIVSNS